MVDRIKSIMGYYHLSPAQFADKIGFQRSALSHILSERNKPSLDFVLKVKNAFPNLNLDWLTMGNGNQFVNPEEKLGEPVEGTLKIDLDDGTEEEVVGKPNIEKENVPEEQKSINKDSDSQSAKSETIVNQQFTREKRIKKIILLYHDGSFSEHIPEK